MRLGFVAAKGLVGKVDEDIVRECRCVLAAAGCVFCATDLVYAAGSSAGICCSSRIAGLLRGPSGIVKARSGTALATVKTLMGVKTSSWVTADQSENKSKMRLTSDEMLQHWSLVPTGVIVRRVGLDLGRIVAGGSSALLRLKGGVKRPQT